jgi:Flp pilus assembly protein TadG
MPFEAIARQFSGTARRFASAENGNIAVVFAIALLPLLSFIGAAIDYSRANKARSAMQAALDSTSLMLAKDLSSGVITEDEISSKAQAYFAALYTDKEAQSVSVNATYTAKTGSGSTILVNGSGSVATDFMKVAGFPTIDFGSSSTSAWGNARMRVAMVLDNTGSMADDGKMPAMQTAAKNLVDQLSGLAKTSGDIYISIVPFAKDVNLGTANNAYQLPWIDWRAWDAANPTVGTCSNTSYTSKTSCESHSKVWTPDHTKWTGCFTDRAQDYDTMNTTPTATNSDTLFPAEEYTSGSTKYCKTGTRTYLQPIMPLSYDWSSLKTEIDNMVPTGNTNQAIGLAWGWMTLMGNDPFNAPAKDPNYNYKDAIILLSDGLNTQDRWYSNASQIDNRQQTLCDNIKAVKDANGASQYTIYTIQVNTSKPPDATSKVLQNCASSPADFFLVTSASQTVDVFKQIGISLSQLRVAK